GERGEDFEHVAPAAPEGLPRLQDLILNVGSRAAYSAAIQALSDPGSRAIQQLNVAQPGRFTFVRDRYVYHADAALYEVRVHSPAGKLVRIVRADIPPLLIPEAEKRDTTYSVGGLNRGAQVTHAPERVVWPEHYPHFSGMFVDRLGN